MLSPGGALLRLDMPGVFAANWSTPLSLPVSGRSPFADCCCRRASMIWRCCSRTLKLRCNCSFMAGSCVTKPGDKQARPTSMIPSPSLSPGSLAVCAPEPARPPLERSSFRGLWRGGGITGEPGSFLTTILGAVELDTFRLKHSPTLEFVPRNVFKTRLWWWATYAVGEDLFCWPAALVGLPLPVRVTFGVDEVAAGRVAAGDVDGGGARATAGGALAVVAGARSA